jgi:3-oxoacyl-[acyl-carrier-protein] synthase-3
VVSEGVAQPFRAADEEPAAQPSRAARLRRVKIAGLSTYVPPKLLTNHDLEKLVETTDEWILQRTGIKQRHIVEPGIATSDLAKEAAVGAMQQAGV